MNKKFQPLNNYLKNSVEFATIRAKLQQNKGLLQQIRMLLPTAMSEHCTDAVAIDHDQLILYVDSSAWASRLRFFSGDLAIKLREKQQFFKKIYIKISIDNSKTQRTQSKKRTRFLSGKNSELLRKIANHTPDPELRAALERLSTHTEP